MSRNDATGDHLRPADIVVLMLLIGLIVGSIEGGYLTVQRTLLGELSFASPDAWWMSPLAYGVLFLVAAAPPALVALLWPAWAHRSLALLLGPGLAGYSLLAFAAGQKLSRIAIVLLACGAAVQVVRMFAHSPRRWMPIARRALLVLLLALPLGAGTSRWFERWAETRRLHATPAPRAGAPNILIIILDTVRAASLSLYGYPRPTTPALERWAARGVVFDRAHVTAPWTLPSHVSMFTGRYHYQQPANWLVPLDPETRTLAQEFEARGYRTAGFVANAYYTSQETGLARGFAHFEDYARSPLQFFRSATLYQEVEGVSVGRFSRKRPYDRKRAAAVSAGFLDWLAEAPADRPFFAFLNYFDAHTPRPRVPAGSPFAGARPPVDNYDYQLARLDAALDTLLTALEARGELERTLVVITSDHGELFEEHGLSTHGNSLYYHLLHVPLLILGPGVPEGVRVPAPVTMRDLSATVATLGDLPPSVNFPGRSLSRFFGTPADTAEPPSPILAEVTRPRNSPDDEPVAYGSMRSLVDDSLHYIRRGDGAEELYRYATDPVERINLAGDSAYAKALAAFRAELDALPLGYLEEK
jgi:arylsulfatase A-like enzyme